MQESSLIKMLRVLSKNCFSLLPRIKYTSFYSTENIYVIKPERLQEIAKSPSGWVQRANPPPELPFDIDRSRTNNLPVYVNYKAGGSKVVTIIRKVRGDLKELEKCVRSRLGDDLHYQINELTSQLHIKGDHKDQVKRLLKELGF